MTLLVKYYGDVSHKENVQRQLEKASRVAEELQCEILVGFVKHLEET